MICKICKSENLKKIYSNRNQFLYTQGVCKSPTDERLKKKKKLVFKGLAKLEKDNKITNFLPGKHIQCLHYEKEAHKMWIITKPGVYYLKNGIFVNYDRKLKITGKEDKENIIKGLIIKDSGIKYFYSL